MAERRHYSIRLISGLRIANITRIACASDDEARGHAARIPLVSAVEIWSGNRKVCRFPDTSIEDGNAEPSNTPGPDGGKQAAVSHDHRSAHWELDTRQLVEGSKAAIKESREMLSRPVRRA